MTGTDSRGDSVVVQSCQRVSVRGLVERLDWLEAWQAHSGGNGESLARRTTVNEVLVGSHAILAGRDTGMQADTFLDDGVL